MGHVLEKERLELATAYRAQRCIETFYEFYREFWDINNSDQPLIDNFHIQYLCDEAQKVVERAIRKQEKEGDLIINIPPGMSKSSIISQALPAWIWLKAPWFVIITSSSTDSLALENSDKSKNIINSARFHRYFQSHFKQTFKKEFRITKNTNKVWRNNFGGCRFVSSTRSSIIGRHAHLLIVDDPLELEQAASEAGRSKANNHVGPGLNNRKKDKKITPLILVMQRLHENDPTNFLLKTGAKVIHIKLPAEHIPGKTEVKPAKLVKFYQDGLLDPVRLDRKILGDNFKILGGLNYSCQFDQEAYPLEGNKVKMEWFVIEEEAKIPTHLQWNFLIDGAYTQKTTNDPTGMLATGYDKFKDILYVRNFHFDYLELPDLLDFLEGNQEKGVPSYLKKNGYSNRSMVDIEPKASGKSLRQFMARDGWNAREIKSHLVGEGKEARLQAALSKIQAGKIVLVKGQWNDSFMAQLCFFPNYDKDEGVDLLGYAVDLYMMKEKPRGPRKVLGEQEIIAMQGKRA